MKFFLFLMVIFSCNAVTKSELEAQGQDKLESSFEHAGMGLVGVGYGAYAVTKGDYVGGAVSIGAGVKEFKDSLKDFREAKELFEKSRTVNDE